MFYLIAHPRFAQYILAHSLTRRLTHNPKMAQDLVQDGGVLADGTMTMWAWPGCSLAQAGRSPSLLHTMSGLDWLIGSSDFPEGQSVFWATKAGVQSWYWAEIYRRCYPWAVCTGSPLAECSPADDVITPWLQLTASPCLACLSQRCLLEDAEKEARKCTAEREKRGTEKARVEKRKVHKPSQLSVVKWETFLIKSSSRFESQMPTEDNETGKVLACLWSKTHCCLQTTVQEKALFWHLV